MPGKSKKRQAVEQAVKEAVSLATGIVDGRYLKAFDRRAHGYALLGHTNAEIAELFAISPAQFDVWLVEHPSLAAAIRKARVDDHVRVVRSMHRAANGFRAREDKLIVVGGQVERHSVTKVYPPSVPASTLLLTNRHADKWRDKGGGEGGNTLNLSLILERAGLGDDAKLVAGEVVGTAPLPAKDDAT